MKKRSLSYDTTPKKAPIYYINKQTKETQIIHDDLYRNLSYITRANDPSRYISLKAEKVLTNLIKMISKNPYKEEFVDHDFLSELNRTKNAQNANILAQLADVIDYEYRNCIKFHGKRKVYGYVVKFTGDGQKRIENPELFYSFNSPCKLEINNDPSQNKLSLGSKKISTPTIYKKKETEKETFCSFVTLDIPRKEEEVHCVDIGLSTSDNSDNLQSKKNTKIEIKSELTKEKQVELLQSLSGNTTPPPAITNLMKSEIYKAPETYTWDYEQYRKDHGLDKIKEETAVTIVSKGMEMLKNLKVIKQEEVAAPPATSAEFAHVDQSGQLETPEVSRYGDSYNAILCQSMGITIDPSNSTLQKTQSANRGIFGQLPQEFDKPVLSINANGRFEPNSEFKPNFLRNYRFNRQQFDEIRILTNDLELTDDEIIGTIQQIVNDNPNTQVWGGRKAFVNFMVKVMKNRRKATLEDDSESIADIERKKYEKALYNFENKIIEWF